MSNSLVYDAVSSLSSIPESIEKLMFSTRANEGSENRVATTIPADILETPKEYIFYMDVPSLSKSDIQVTVEDEKTLVIKSGGKRKREDGEEEECKYIRLERRAPQKTMRKFRLPENANAGAISAKCENGVCQLLLRNILHLPSPRLWKLPSLEMI